MWRIPTRLRPALAIHFTTRFAIFFTVSWTFLSLLLRLDPVTVTAAGFLITVISIALEWLAGPYLIVTLLNPRWTGRENDTNLWSLVESEADKAGVKVRRIGILNMEAPNALIIASVSGHPSILFTKGLLSSLHYSEVRVVTANMMGAVKSGFLSAVTTLSGLLTLSHRIAGGYIESCVTGKKKNIFQMILAAIGYLLFVLTVPQSVMASRPMTLYEDEHGITQTSDPSSLLTALLKVATGTAGAASGPSRILFTPVKGLMFLDPTIALRDSAGLEKAAQSYGIDTKRLLGHDEKGYERRVVIEFHMFERFWSQPNLIDRFRRVVSFGKGVKFPIKVGLAWIE
ncbi:MAG: M48 family metalloprotease [Candidatus Bathyarchaeota archaeon]|nr:MAG: M48 family metalloprotease [Candidatus Bathyarchaeota archaeon]